MSQSRSVLSRLLKKIPKIITTGRYHKLKSAFKERAIIIRARLPLHDFVNWSYEFVPIYAYQEVFNRCKNLEAHIDHLNGELEARASTLNQLNGQLEAQASMLNHVNGELERRVAMDQTSAVFVDWPNGFVPAHVHQRVLELNRKLEAHVDNLNHQIDMRGSAVSSLSVDPSSSSLAVGSKPPVDPLRHNLDVLLNVDSGREFARDFQYISPFLAQRREIPIKPDLMDRVGSLHVIDIGAQELESEPHIYCELLKNWPCQVTGFDPFNLTPAEKGDHFRTLPYFIGTGSPSTFHVNYFDPTSSLLESNLAGLTPFPVLAKMLTTTETHNIETIRLDDLRTRKLIAEQPVDFLKIDTQGTTLDILAHGENILKEVLVCHLEAEFCQLYRGESEFNEVDIFMKKCGFSFLDFYSLGRVRYGVFDNGTPNSKFHHGRTMWCDAVYVRGLDRLETLSIRELLAQAVLLHEIYNKQDVSAHIITEVDRRIDGNLSKSYTCALS